LPYAGVSHSSCHSRATINDLDVREGVYAEPAQNTRDPSTAGLRGLGEYGRATTWLPPQGRICSGQVVILGGGGITESLLRLLEPFVPT